MWSQVPQSHCFEIGHKRIWQSYISFSGNGKVIPDRGQGPLEVNIVFWTWQDFETHGTSWSSVVSTTRPEHSHIVHEKGRDSESLFLTEKLLINYEFLTSELFSFLLTNLVHRVYIIVKAKYFEEIMLNTLSLL